MYEVLWHTHPVSAGLGFKYWIWTQFWQDVEVAHSLADWVLNVCLPKNQARVWPALYTFDSWLPGLAARMLVTGNADQSWKDGSGQQVGLLWFPVTPIQRSWGLWPFTEGWEAARFDFFFLSSLFCCYVFFFFLFQIFFSPGFFFLPLPPVICFFLLSFHFIYLFFHNGANLCLYNSVMLVNYKAKMWGNHYPFLWRSLLPPLIHCQSLPYFKLHTTVLAAIHIHDSTQTTPIH